jgi:hypothetical protein
MATYLEYTCTPTQLIEGETQDLIVIATLKTKEQLGVELTSAAISQIVLDFGEVGTGATNLTGTAFTTADIQPPMDWNVSVSGVTCTLTPSGAAGTISTNALVVTIKSVQVNSALGNVTLTVKEAATPTPQTGGEPPTTTTTDPGVETITLTKVAAGPTQLLLTAVPEVISAGDSTTLKWAGGDPTDTYVLKCLPLENGSLTTITKHANGTPLSTPDRYPNPYLTPPDKPLTLEQITRFTLSYGKKGGVTKSVSTIVYVTGGLIKSFSASPTIIDVTQGPQPVELDWDTEDGEGVSPVTFSIEPYPSDPQTLRFLTTHHTPTGSQTITLASASTITLTVHEHGTIPVHSDPPVKIQSAVISDMWTQLHGNGWNAGVNQMLVDGDYLVVGLGGGAVMSLPVSSISTHEPAWTQMKGNGWGNPVSQMLVVGDYLVVGLGGLGAVYSLPVSSVGTGGPQWTQLHGTGWNAGVNQMLVVGDYLVVGLGDGAVMSLPVSSVGTREPQWTQLQGTGWVNPVNQMLVIDDYLVVGLGGSGAVMSLPVDSIGTSMPAWTQLHGTGWAHGVNSMLVMSNYLVVGLSGGAVMALPVSYIGKQSESWIHFKDNEWGNPVDNTIAVTVNSIDYLVVGLGGLGAVMSNNSVH